MRRFRDSLRQVPPAERTPAKSEEPLSEPNQGYLLIELENLYWDGIRTELENILRTLDSWVQSQFNDITIGDSDNHIHGFDTFVDQVSKEARAFAIRYGQEKETRGITETNNSESDYDRALQNVLEDRKAEHDSTSIKLAVRKAIRETPSLTEMQKRAWMLLQSAGFLDIEKLVEHRPPLDTTASLKRPAVPQLTLSKISENGTPTFAPQQCSRPDCRRFICGSMFVSNQDEKNDIICEDCYQQISSGNNPYIKRYKHCILFESISGEISRQMCNCPEVPQVDSAGRPLSLFPVDQESRHLGMDGSTTEKCRLLKLADAVAQAKYGGLQAVAGISDSSESFSLPSRAAEKANIDQSNSEKGKLSRIVSAWKSKTRTGPPQNSLHDVKASKATPNSATVVTKAEDDTDIPLLIRTFADNNPFGNVHMVLRVGPLIIENNTTLAKGGATIAVRDMPIFEERFALSFMADRVIVLDDTDRKVGKHARPQTSPKKYKAIMKQVVGVPFSDIPQGDELLIIDELLSVVHQRTRSGSSATFDSDRLASVLDPILAKLKALMGSRVKVYLGSLSEKLMDRTTKLSWSAASNNCLKFCNALIDQELFAPLVNGPAPETATNSTSDNYEPLYVMSFVCPDERYIKRRVESKFDVPSGLTEEYLMRFHFGRHDEVDILDSLQEYWHDWGAFGCSLYKYQDVFPWDCTEAYGRYPTRCGDCNLAKHVWAFPFDSWSMAALHLTREQWMYPSLGDSDAASAWTHNRLNVLVAGSVLSRGAAAMAKTPRFCKATAWLHAALPPPATQSVKRRELIDYDPSLARVRLGGIHRAQPFSHHFEAGQGDQYFLASWALLPRQQQIEHYEKLRNARAQAPEVLAKKAPKFDSSATSQGQDLGSFNGQSLLGFDLMAAAVISTVLIDSHLMDAGFTDTAVDGGANCGSGCGTVADALGVDSVADGAADGGGFGASCGGGLGGCGGGGHTAGCGGTVGCGGGT